MFSKILIGKNVSCVGGGGPCIDVPTLAYICSYLRNLCVKEAGGQLPDNLYPWVQKTCKKTCGLC